MKKLRYYVPVLLALGCLMLLDSGCTKRIRKQRLLSQANADFEAGRYDKAAEEYARAIQINKSDPVANRQLAILYFNEGNDVQALMYLRKALDLTPDNPDVQLKYAALNFAHGGYKEAVAGAKKVLAVIPDSEDALLILAKSAHTPAEIDQTRQFIERLRQRDKDRAVYHLAFGSLDLYARDPVGAEREYKLALALDPKSSGAYLNLGSIALEIHRNPKEADEDFKKAAALAPVRSPRRLRYIEYKASIGRMDEAKQALADITREAPDYIPALILSMKIAFEEKRYADCESAIQRLLERDPQNYDGLLQRGTLKRVEGDLDGAISDLRHAQGVYSRNLQLEYQLALTYMQKGDLTQARNLFNEALILSPKFEPAVLFLADINLRSGNPAAAADALTEWIKEKSPSARAYVLLAQADLAQKQPERAIETYRAMAKAYPLDPQSDFLIGMTRLAQKRSPDARAAFERSLSIAPNYGPALEQLIDLDLNEKQFASAAARVKAMMTKYPGSATPWLFQFKIDLAQRQVPTAEADLQKAIDLEPSRQESYLALVNLYMETNQTQAALDHLNALAAKTNSVTSYMEIALIQITQKNYSAAAAAYQKAIAADPKSAAALNNLAYLDSENLGKREAGLALAKKAHELNPSDPDTDDTLGWIQFQLGNYRAALPLLQQSADKLPAGNEVQFHLGMAHYMLEEEGPARAAFQAALATPKPFVGRDEAVRRLALLNLDGRTATAANREDLERRLRQEPTDPVVRVRLAEIQERDGLAGPAAENLEAALKLNPNNPPVLLELSHLYDGTLHRPDRSMELAQRAHELLPNDVAVAQSLGHQLYLAGDYEHSMSLLRNALQTATDQPELQYDLARDYYNVGRIPEAEAALAIVAQSRGAFSRRAEANDFATLVASTQNPVQAAAAAVTAQKILATNAADVPAQMVSGLVQEQKGNYAPARQIYEKILSNDPLFSPATRQLALLYAEKLGDDGKAYDFAIKAREAFPDDAELAGVLGILDYRRSDYAAAANLFQASLAKQADAPEMVYYLGMAHFQLKEMGDAKRELQHALDLNVNEQEAEQARRALDEMKGAINGPSLLAQPIN